MADQKPVQTGDPQVPIAPPGAEIRTGQDMARDVPKTPQPTDRELGKTSPSQPRR